MATPQFVLVLREKVGHDLLWLTGVSAIVRNENGEYLLAQRADNNKWALISGILEPGEQPADAIVREIKEETDLDAHAVRLIAVVSDENTITYGNGDITQYLDLMFECALTEGGNRVTRPADGENLNIGWFRIDSLPDNMTQSSITRLQRFETYQRQRETGTQHAMFMYEGKLV